MIKKLRDCICKEIPTLKQIIFVGNFFKVSGPGLWKQLDIGYLINEHFLNREILA